MMRKIVLMMAILVSFGFGGASSSSNSGLSSTSDQNPNPNSTSTDAPPPEGHGNHVVDGAPYFDKKACVEILIKTITNKKNGEKHSNSEIVYLFVDVCGVTSISKENWKKMGVDMK